MPLICCKLSCIELSDIKKFNFMIFASGEEINTIDWIPPYLLKVWNMGFHCAYRFSISWIPHNYVFVFATSHDQALKWMPVATRYDWTVACEIIFLLWSQEIPHLGCGIIRTRNKLNGTHWKWYVSNTVFWVSLESILLTNHFVAVNDIPTFISCYQILMVVRPCHCLDSFLMDINTVYIDQFLSIPLYNLPLTWASHTLFPIFQPFNLIEWFFLSIFTLA